MPNRHYQTTPIYYVNDRPHLGTAYSMVLADAVARWHRLIGDEVFFLTGTDEHGLKIVRAAAERGLEPSAWVDEASEWFKKAWVELNMSNDAFIRTTEERHHRAVQRFMQTIYDGGYIYKGEYAGWYCVACENYYAESELLEGQCCPVHLTPVEWITEENYFFRLSAFSDRLLEWYEGHPRAVVPESRRNEALGLIRQGLSDISITRTSFEWGVKVPWDAEHVFYVWYDALVNYVTAIGYGEDDVRFSQWWPAVCHLIGKDILKFHCVWWPAMCMAAGIDPPAEIVVHGFLLVGGEKMSKSRANQLNPVEIAADVGLDPLRHYLLRDIVVGSDGDFTYEGLVARYNADLANNLGNLLQRVATVVGQKCGGIGPAPRTLADTGLGVVATEVVDRVRHSWDAFLPHAALEATWTLVHEANAALEIAEPWKKEPGSEVDGVLGDALEVLRLVAILASPAMPETSEAIWQRIGLGVGAGDRGRADPLHGELVWGRYPGGLRVPKGEPLFPRRRVERSPA